VTDTESDLPITEFDELLEERVNERTRLVTRAKRTWQATFDAIVDPLAIVDTDMRIVRTNLAHAAYANEDVRSVNGRLCHELLFGRDGPCLGCPVPDTRATASTAESEILDSGRDRVLRVWSFPMQTFEEDSEGEYTVCHYKDITDEKVLQKQLVQSEKMAAVGTLAGGVAHEVNNPLGAILAFSQLGLQDSDEGTTIHEFFREIEDSALRCKRIVESLLNFSRISRGERVAVNLQEIADRALFLCNRRFQQRNVGVTSEYGDDVSTVIGDPNQLQQVILNLLNNAADACSSGGMVTIRTGEVAHHSMYLEVSDDGEGIDATHLEKVFEPFFTTKPEGEGTGLGLSISYGIIEDHGGTITIGSDTGVGTTFKIVFPLPSAQGGDSQ
jgi:two-component system NtrC family sensor kinase